MSLMESGTGMCRDSGTVKPLRGLAGCRGLDGGGAPSRASGLSGDLQWTGSADVGIGSDSAQQAAVLAPSTKWIRLAAEQ